MGPRTLLDLPTARALLAGYSLRVEGVAPLNRGTVNSNYRVDTDEGPLFLRINEGKTEADARFEAALIWHLGSVGFPTPALWRARQGAPYVLLRGPGDQPPKPVMLMQWAGGIERGEDDIGEGEAQAVGVVLALLHIAAGRFPQRREGIYTLGGIQARIARLHAEPRIPDGTVEHLQREAERLAGARRRDLPSGLGHGDLFPDNAFFAPPRRGREAAVAWLLDLEQAATLPYVYDLAVALLAFCAPVAPGEGARVGPLHRARARALAAGYVHVRQLSPGERHGLYEELRFAALRFTVTRLTDVHLRRERARAGAQGEPGAPSKDYRDFLRRLEALEGVGAEELAAVLF